MTSDNPFIYITTQFAYTIVSDAAAKRGMTVAQYVSLAISRQIEDDKRAENISQNMEESQCDGSS
jgi:benzoyl-CoA reductase/2-hydroxyglutaryl-CoA dehydratase subunit BcrC/BadD/HgdB